MVVASGGTGRIGSSFFFARVWEDSERVWYGRVWCMVYLFFLHVKAVMGGYCV